VADGRIVERGKHHELLARGGLYADLYNTQFDSQGRIDVVEPQDWPAGRV